MFLMKIKLTMPLMKKLAFFFSLYPV